MELERERNRNENDEETSQAQHVPPRRFPDGAQHRHAANAHSRRGPSSIMIAEPNSTATTYGRVTNFGPRTPFDTID